MAIGLGEGWSGELRHGRMSRSPRTQAPPRRGVALLLLGALLLATGCATGSALLEEGSTRGLLAPALACASPADFIHWQQGVDMPRLVERLGDWEAVRLGALGPVREEAAALLNRKRAAFLLHTTEEYGAARAEVLALFVLHSAYDDDVRQVLALLARDKRLGQTLGLMPTVREELARRGLPLSDTPDRDWRWSDLARGVARAGVDMLDSSPARDGAKGFSLFLLREQLPAPYQHALDEVERAQWQGHLSPGNVVLGGFDQLTFGVPLGFYHLAVGTGHGLYTLSQGEYEQATRELTPLLLLVSLHAGGKALGTPAEPGLANAEPGLAGAERLGWLEQRASVLRQVARQLEHLLGAEGIRGVAREIQASREAGRFVAVGGADAAVALHEARGDVARAQVLMMSRDRPEATGASSPGKGEAGARAEAGRGDKAKTVRAEEGRGGVESLSGGETGLSPEVLKARLAEAEGEAAGPRLPMSVKALEKQRPVLEAPPAEARENPRWQEYVEYYEERLGEVRQGKALKGPLRWEAYEQLRGWFSRGMRFEATMVERLRADAALPRAQRRFLGDFDKPRIERSVGVSKPGTGLRFADVLVIEEGESSGPTPRVETFSCKSRNLAPMDEKELQSQMREDASAALKYYGGTLDIRRISLKPFFKASGQVLVQRVHLIYEGGHLKPTKVSSPMTLMEGVQEMIPGVEVSLE